MAEPHDPYGALRHRDYRLLLGGGVLASVGAEMQAVAVGWELYERTQSAAALGWVGIAQFLPVLLLSLPAGHVADRVNRLRLLQTAHTGVALASLTLAALAFWQGPVALVYVALLVSGASRAFGVPARWSLLPQVVPTHLLGNAVTWNSSAWQVASVTGPALGGWVIGLAAGAAAPAFAVAATCSMTCVLLLSFIRPHDEPRPIEGRSLSSLLAGVRFVWSRQPLLAAITLDLFAVLLGGATALLPIFAHRLDIGAEGLGWLRAAPAIGALVTALLLAHLPPLRRPGWALLLAVAGFGLATIGFGLSEDPLLSFVLLALTGAFDNVSVVVRGTLVQVLTPHEMRGRVASVNLVFISSSNELGAFESGMTAEWFGPVPSVVGGGIGTILVVLGVALRWPELLRLGTLSAAQTEEAEEEVASRIGGTPAPK
jgi:MFS family permease